jgi:hypothetical protein
LCPHVYYKEFLTFTPFFVQEGRTVLMHAAGKKGGASIEIMQLLLDSGAAASINDHARVAHLR